MQNKKWRDCIKDPPETAKKVLCHRKGDLYVAIRLFDKYVPMPFVTHHFCSELLYPETWQDIDFPVGITGYLRVCMNKNSKELITMSEAEVDYPEFFKEFAEAMINSVGSLKNPHK